MSFARLFNRALAASRWDYSTLHDLPFWEGGCDARHEALAAEFEPNIQKLEDAVRACTSTADRQQIQHELDNLRQRYEERQQAANRSLY